jgi:AraC-like DNA-binding protein
MSASLEPYPKVYLYRRIVQAKLFMDAHYAKPIDLDNIADEAYFSKFHFIRLFKMAYGRTPHQYLTYVRIQRACMLLEEGRAVSDACLEVGFDSLSTFSGLFKRIMGCPPSVYQARQMLIQSEMQTAPLKFVPNCFANADTPL